jgi:hypothetical protein
MWPTISNILYTSLALHPSSRTARRRAMSAGTRGVGSQCCSTTGSRYRSRRMEASSWVVLSPELWSIPQGVNA